MYSRKVTESPEHLIKNGKALFGTYSGVPTKIDIKGMKAPYAGVPLPPFISSLRIKNRLNFYFSTERYIGLTDFFDFKLIGIAQTILWDKTTGKKMAYHNIMPTQRHFIPHKTDYGTCTSFRKKRHIRISWGREHKHHSIAFNLKGDSVRPNVDGFISSPIQDSMHTDLLFVNPSPTSSRCSATWFTAMQTRGLIRVEGEKKDESNGLAAMRLNRTYFKFLSTTDTVCGLGKIKEKDVVFNLKCSTFDSTDSNNYNDNVLIVDGEASPLPPVYMTHSFGVSKPWIIQDTESMVDLTFSPISCDKHIISLITTRYSNMSIYGTFEGVLLTKDGEKLIVKGLPGIINSNIVRL